MCIACMIAMGHVSDQVVTVTVKNKRFSLTNLYNFFSWCSCEDKCLRSFHPNINAGVESSCESLGYSDAQVEVWTNSHHIIFKFIYQWNNIMFNFAQCFCDIYIGFNSV